LIAETSQAAEQAIDPYLAAGYRGMPPDALLGVRWGQWRIK